MEGAQTSTPSAQGKEPTREEKVRAQVMDTLQHLGSLTTGDDSLVFEGDKFILPANMRGNIRGAAKYLIDYEKQQETSFRFTRKFPFRMWDGAAAFDRAMQRVFGTAGLGQSTYDFFGQEHKPELKTINVSVNQTIQVPCGVVAFPPLAATFELGGTRDPELGVVFDLAVEAPRKFRQHIEAFYQVVEHELKTGSIYRGKAITGAADPGFIDPYSVDPKEVVYSEEVQVQLETNMWSLLRYTDRMRENNIPLKRAVLIEGPYGTGKSMAGKLTAREAIEHGWTFLLARPGKDDLQTVLQTAQLYAPAVVWYEDIDVLAQGHSDQQISNLLDALDGITAKGVEVLAGFTTNHVDKIQKGVLRPGRLDAVIHVGGLDAEGFERLIKVIIPESTRGEIDYPLVAKAFEGFLPAFAKEAIDRAKRYSITRNYGMIGRIETDDLVHAANGLRPQLELMERAQEGVVRPTLDSAVRNAVEGAVTGMRLVDYGGDAYNALLPAAVLKEKDHVKPKVEQVLRERGEE